MNLHNDPLDDLLLMSLDEIIKQIKYAYDFYMEEENCDSQVAKIKALQEFSLWFNGDKNKEIQLRELVEKF